MQSLMMHRLSEIAAVLLRCSQQASEMHNSLVRAALSSCPRDQGMKQLFHERTTSLRHTSIILC